MNKKDKLMMEKNYISKRYIRNTGRLIGYVGISIFFIIIGILPSSRVGNTFGEGFTTGILIIIMILFVGILLIVSWEENEIK